MGARGGERSPDGCAELPSSGPGSGFVTPVGPLWSPEFEDEKILTLTAKRMTGWGGMDAAKPPKLPAPQPASVSSPLGWSGSSQRVAGDGLPVTGRSGCPDSTFRSVSAGRNASRTPAGGLDSSAGWNSKARQVGIRGELGTTRSSSSTHLFAVRLNPPGDERLAAV